MRTTPRISRAILCISCALVATLAPELPHVGAGAVEWLQNIAEKQAMEAQWSAPSQGSFTVYSDPIVLHPTEVHNRAMPPVDFPKEIRTKFGSDSGEQMVITNYNVDIVSRDSAGVETPVPLYDVYNHHFILYVGDTNSMGRLYADFKGRDPLGTREGTCWHDHPSKPNQKLGCSLRTMSHAGACLNRLQKNEYDLGHKPLNITSFGGASGGEFRNNPHRYPENFGVVVKGVPEQLVSVWHFINTMGTAGEDSPSPLLECPCTDERHFNLQNNTIDGCPVSPPFFCNDWFQRSKNSACSLRSYVGGYRCCENGVYLARTAARRARARQSPTITVYAKLTLHYRTLSLRPTRPLLHAGLDSTWGPQHNSSWAGNIEYDVPRCAAGTPPHECVHTVTNVEPLAGYLDPETEVDLVYAVAHVHTGAISATMIDDVTGELICNAKLIYGASQKAGDEAGYLTGILPCIWPKGKRFRAGHKIQMITRYNSTESHTGVMSLWLNMVALADP